jgi:hypothetical protein
MKLKIKNEKLKSQNKSCGLLPVFNASGEKVLLKANNYIGFPFTKDNENFICVCPCLSVAKSFSWQVPGDFSFVSTGY